MDKFVEIHNLSKLTQEIKNMKTDKRCKSIDAKSLNKRTGQKSKGFTGEFYQTQRIITPSVSNSLEKNKRLYLC